MELEVIPRIVVESVKDKSRNIRITRHRVNETSVVYLNNLGEMKKIIN